MAITTVLGILKSSKFERDLKGAAGFCATYGSHLTALAVSIGAAPSLSQYDAISTIWLDERQREIDGKSADAIITRHAVDMGADLIVMGAYNHPRWQQSLFGGVTRRMIEDCQLPLFLAH